MLALIINKLKIEEIKNAIIKFAYRHNKIIAELDAEVYPQLSLKLQREIRADN